MKKLRKIKFRKIYKIVGYNVHGEVGIVHKTTDEATHLLMKKQLRRVWKIEIKEYRGIL